MITTKMIRTLDIVIIGTPDRFPTEEWLNTQLWIFRANFLRTPKVLEDTAGWRSMSNKLAHKKTPLKSSEQERVDKFNAIKAGKSVSKRYSATVCFAASPISERSVIDFAERIIKNAGVEPPPLEIKTEQLKERGGGGDTFEHIFIEHIEEKKVTEFLFSLHYETQFEPTDVIKISADGKTKTLYDGTIITEN